MTDEQKAAQDRSMQATKDGQAAQKAQADAVDANQAAADKIEEDQAKLRQQIADLEAKMAEMAAGPMGYVTVDHTGKVVS